MTWYDESENEKKRTREWLVENFPGESTLIVATFDVAWSGWECDWKGALVIHGEVPELVIVDGTSMTGNIPDELEQRVRDYRRMADETEAALRRYRELGGLFGDAWREATNARHQLMIALERREQETEYEHAARIATWNAARGVTSEVITTIDVSRRPAFAADVPNDRVVWELMRDPGETDAEYLSRKSLFENDPSGGREQEAMEAPVDPSEGIEARTNDANGDPEGYDPKSIEFLRDLKPKRERPKDHIVDMPNERADASSDDDA